MAELNKPHEWSSTLVRLRAEMFTSALLIAATWFWQLKLSHLPLLSWDVGEGHEPAPGLILVFLLAFYAYATLGLLLRWQVEVAATSSLDEPMQRMDDALEKLNQTMTLKDRRGQLERIEKRSDELASAIKSIPVNNGKIAVEHHEVLEQILNTAQAAAKELRDSAFGLAVTPRTIEELRATFTEAEEAIGRSAAEIRNLMSAERFERTVLGFWAPALSSFTLVALTTAAAWPEILSSLDLVLSALWTRILRGGA